jgi:hypothetical protein
MRKVVVSSQLAVTIGGVLAALASVLYMLIAVTAVSVVHWGVFSNYTLIF